MRGHYIVTQSQTIFRKPLTSPPPVNRDTSRTSTTMRAHHHSTPLRTQTTTKITTTLRIQHVSGHHLLGSEKKCHITIVPDAASAESIFDWTTPFVRQRLLLRRRRRRHPPHRPVMITVRPYPKNFYVWKSFRNNLKTYLRSKSVDDIIFTNNDCVGGEVWMCMCTNTTCRRDSFSSAVDRFGGNRVRYNCDNATTTVTSYYYYC